MGFDTNPVDDIPADKDEYERWEQERVRAAAARLLQCGPFWVDVRAVVSAYLVEHLADDAEPLTVDWLRSVGGTDPCGHGMLYLKGFGISLYFEHDRLGRWQASVEQDDQCVGFGEYKTRGDVRRVARVLGIKLKE